MAGILDSVNQRTQLVGQNRLELLLFRLGARQVYGINVFKVKEVLQCPPLNAIPKRHPVVRGVAHVRGGTIPVMDLSHATGGKPLEDLESSFVIITEYNRSVQGFLVGSVERIVNTNWNDIQPPPKGAGNDNYLTAVTDIEGKLVEIIDVEKILAEVAPIPADIQQGFIDSAQAEVSVKRQVLIADDSTVARNQVKGVVESLGLSAVTCENGKEALDYLHSICDSGKDVCEEFLMIISDIEMPEMDGYTLTTEIRADKDLAGLYVVLHTSLSGVFNKAMVKKVTANSFCAKFKPNELAEHITTRIEQMKVSDAET